MAVVGLGGSGGEREAIADHSYCGASSFNTNVGGQSEAFADHPHDGASSFNTDTGGEKHTAALRQAPEAPVNDVKLSKVDKDAHAEVRRGEYQSVLRFLSKLSEFPDEVQRPEMDEAGVTAKASDLMIALDAAMLSTFRVIKFTRIKLQAYSPTSRSWEWRSTISPALRLSLMSRSSTSRPGSPSLRSSSLRTWRP